MKNNIIAKRDDGFTISYSTFRDFKKLQNLVRSLSKEGRCQFTPWLFNEKPSMKERIGQIIARLSLLPVLRQIIKKFLPLGYVVILKLESNSSELAGFMYLHKFQRHPNGFYTVTVADVIGEKFRGLKLSTFQRETMYKQVKAYGVRHMIVDIFLDNVSSLPFYKKTGWKKIGIESEKPMSCGKKHSVVKFRKDVLD